MRSLTHELRTKISNYIKSGIDISDLIKDYTIQNENLSYAIISNFDHSNQDISGCKLTGAKIAKANLMCATARNVNFDYADLSNANCRSLDALGSTFLRTNCKDTDFCHADLRSCNLCDITLTISARYLYKTKVSKNIMNLLDKVWLVVDDETKMQFTEPR